MQIFTFLDGFKGNSNIVKRRDKNKECIKKIKTPNLLNNPYKNGNFWIQKLI